MSQQNQTERQDRPFLFILCGVPASGKSTIASSLAEQIESRFGRPVAVVSSDHFRAMISADEKKFEPYRERLAGEMARAAIGAALSNGWITISDDLNYYVSMRRHLSLIAKKLGAGFAVIHVEVPLEKALEWNRKRGTPIPEQLIMDVWSRFELPGAKYGWDRPITIAKPAESSLEEMANELLSGAVKAMELWGKPRETKQVESLQNGEIESITRRAMSEVVTRLNCSSLAPQLSFLRRQVVKDAIRTRLSATEAEKLFTEKAVELLSSYPFEKARGRMVVHIGLFGHVDHGKTAIARCLTEHPSTASLDRAPEAQKRGMTIDMGFSSFVLGEYVINVVDLPGHQDLIRHAVAGASIIDAALLVIDAQQGEGVQTAEHMAIIRDLNIRRLLVVLNKRDLVTPEKLMQMEQLLRRGLERSDFDAWEVTSMSAIRNEGVEDLRAKLRQILIPPVRNWVGPFKMPIDHSFPIQGIGTVTTGTVLRGKVAVGDELEIMPPGDKCRVRIIQAFGENRENAAAGDRIGIALSGPRASDLKRGFVLCQPGTLRPAKLITAELTVDRNFHHTLKCFDYLHLSVGLLSTRAQLIILVKENERNVVVDNVLSADGRSLVFLQLNDYVIAEKGDQILLYKLDLAPKSSRVIGAAVVREVLEKRPSFYRKKIRKGILGQKVGNEGWVVDGLFQSVEGVREFVGQDIRSVDGIRGRIKRPYDARGAVLAEFEKPPAEGSWVEFAMYRRLRI